MSKTRVIVLSLLLSFPLSLHASKEDSSPLLPGSRIVAGDSAQNEFFIVLDNEFETETAPKKLSMQTRKPLSGKIRKAVNSALHSHAISTKAHHNNLARLLVIKKSKTLKRFTQNKKGKVLTFKVNMYRP